MRVRQIRHGLYQTARPDVRFGGKLACDRSTRMIAFELKMLEGCWSVTWGLFGGCLRGA